MAAKERSDESFDILGKDAHPVGTGVGAAGGAIAGAALGSAGGPAGALVGGVIGAVAGGLAGRGVAEMAHPDRSDVNHDREDAYWRETHMSEPYYNPERSYDDYAPAYRMGWESRAKYDGGTYDQYEPAFRNDWDTMRGDSRLDWEEAKHAVRAGWHRIERALPGDADGDAR